MEVGDGERVDEREDFAEFLLILAVESGHHIGCNTSIGHYGFDSFQLTAVEGGVVATMHELEHMVAAGLQGDVEVGKEGAGVGNEVDNLVGEQVGLDGGDAIA